MKIKKIASFVLSLFVILVLFSPSLIFAAVSQPPTAKVCDDLGNKIGDTICKFGAILKALIPLMVALGVVYFVWGVVQYVIGGDSESKKEGRDRIMYGIIGFAIILMFWGFVSLVVNFFGFTQAELAVINPSTILITNNPAPSGVLGTCDAVLGSNPKFQHILSYITCVIGASVIPFIFAIAAAAFLWGMVQFLILGGGQEEKRTQGKQMMIWGLIALTVMVGMWGLVKIAGSTFGISDSKFLPQVRP